MSNWIKDNFKIITFLLGFAFALGWHSYGLEGKVSHVEAQTIAREEISDHAMGIKEGIIIQTIVEGLDNKIGALFRVSNESERRIMERIGRLEKKIEKIGK